MQLKELVRAALAEDLINNRDLTSDLFIPAGVTGEGWIEARESAVVSGLDVTAEVFAAVDPKIRTRKRAEDGDSVSALARVLEVSGSAGGILRAERTALNLLCHLSGIATRTREYVIATRNWNTKILCTRKTTPGLRALEVEAVRHGGGDAYRTNLSDGVLLKDNHIGILGGFENVRVALERLRETSAAGYERTLHDGKIEVSSLDELKTAADMGWRQVLLDNFQPAEVAEAVRLWGDRLVLEMSGGVNATNVAEYAATGVHAISIGAITHSSKAIDFSLEVEWRRS